MSESIRQKRRSIFKVNLLGIGSGLLIFFTLCAFVTAIALILLFLFHGFSDTIVDYGRIIAGIALFENPFLWTGILLIYMSSAYLDFNSKVIGVIFCLVPIVHFAVLVLILKVSIREYRNEKMRLALQETGAETDVCDTRYPILLIHGIFFRDSQALSYWGRIPYYLEKNGARIFYGDHESCENVEKSAEDIAAKIKEIVETTGCEKVNIIAHSKGGLDVKYAVAKMGIEKHVASITTISTPHYGCEYADYFLGLIPSKAKPVLSYIANSIFKRLGDRNPDVLSAVEELTVRRCLELNRETSDFDFKANGIYTQSFGSGLRYGRSGILPLDLFYRVVDRFDGPNDGLVGLASFRWGENYTLLDNGRRRGISHGDMIDITRDKVPGFDVCSFYIDLASNLRCRGL
ncbi:MAG: alpha/beta hydrolase [Clostridia bacterium]|nr:alpha/beta hydrolase [Clostridia bacterium]